MDLIISTFCCIAGTQSQDANGKLSKKLDCSVRHLSPYQVFPIFHLLPLLLFTFLFYFPSPVEYVDLYTLPYFSRQTVDGHSFKYFNLVISRKFMNDYRLQ